MRIRAMALIAAALLATVGASAQAQSYTVRGTVHETGSFGLRPLQGAEIRLSPGDYRAVTDAAGAYAITNVPRGTYTARITGPNHLGVTTSIVVENDVTLNYQLVVSETSRVDVTGFVTETGSFGTRALAGALVRFEPGGYSTTTDASGRFVMPGVPVGTYTVTASAPGHRTMSRSVVVRQGQELRINLPVGEGSGGDVDSAASGVIRSTSGAAISGATIRITPGNVVITTRSDGSFDLPSLRSGTYMLHVKAPGYVPVNRRVSLPSNEALDVTLRPVGSAGRDRDDDDDDDEYEDSRDRDDDDEDEIEERRERQREAEAKRIEKERKAQEKARAAERERVEKAREAERERIEKARGAERERIEKQRGGSVEKQRGKQGRGNSGGSNGKGKGRK